MRTLLADLGDLVEREKVISPAILVIGDVVLLSDAENKLAVLASISSSAFPELVEGSSFSGASNSEEEQGFDKLSQVGFGEGAR